MRIQSIFVWAFAIMMLGVSNRGMANMNPAEKAEFIQTLNQASDALKDTNAGLSKKLHDYAEKKEKAVEKVQESRDQKVQDNARIRQASEQLKTINKDLSDALDDIADRCEKKLKD